jgi:hypothetical protein
LHINSIPKPYKKETPHYSKCGVIIQRIVPLKKIKDYLTLSLKSLPGLKTGTVRAGILRAAPV